LSTCIIIKYLNEDCEIYIEELPKMNKIHSCMFPV